MQTQRLSALSFSSLAFLGRSNSRHPTRLPSDVAPSYTRFPSRVLTGFSFGASAALERNILSGKFEFIDATTVRKPFHQPVAASGRSAHVFMGLETFVSDKKSKVPVFSRLRLFAAQIPGWPMQRSRSRLITSLPRSSRLCETRRSATNLGCVPFPSNSQEPLNETL